MAFFCEHHWMMPPFAFFSHRPIKKLVCAPRLQQMGTPPYENSDVVRWTGLETSVFPSLTEFEIAESLLLVLDRLTIQ